MFSQSVLETVLAVVVAYVFGALPTAYIVARLKKGIDLREYGSGNVGSANLIAHTGKVLGISAGVFDCLVKGTLPVAVSRLIDLNVGSQIGVGLAVVAGHNWSPYIRFTGGRGVATTIGVILGFSMWREFLVLAIVMGVIGWIILHDTGFWTFISALCLAPLAWLFQVYLDGNPPYLVYLSLGLVFLVLLKRITANWEISSAGYSLWQIFLWRLLYDRDVPRQVAWIKRKPSPEKGIQG